mmetsp:Transcript_39332/g.47662  ORF Transcript_39332/g.47662 Transcript_39332/m.47662 type:complete len:255 (-) Transcript_39332:581-1345(-)|eukprot:CAMPEP_0197855622 /NCGR_PEP_ID=MMETSP1438-20131217/26965_1 /TAXON_ID=1461541 /ORGANISM="Pterosperma sp., Strain CCMP1384" /LENGTH=254 /DNA_ID=CAMNT_0043470801 /DNA_START=518 /DNA_END=1282 /DNA_ORIENTATION=+
MAEGNLEYETYSGGQGAGECSMELKYMPEAPEKVIRHRRSISQPLDGGAFFQQPNESGQLEWFQGGEGGSGQGGGSQANSGSGTGAAGGGTAPKVDRKGPHRPPATAALAALVAGAPYVGPDAASAALLDPKRAKRILANRQSAARSKERKLRYIAELERKVSVLQAHSQSAEKDYNLMQEETKALLAEKEDLQQQLERIEKEVNDREVLNRALQGEVQRAALGMNVQDAAAKSQAPPAAHDATPTSQATSTSY